MRTVVDARELEQVARALRRAPKEVRDAIKRDSRQVVAEPLANRIRAKVSGPHTRVLRPGVKTRAGAEPRIVVGGKTPRLTGGGGPRSVVFGTEWGGGKRLSPVVAYQRGGRRAGKVRGYRRYSTNQFRGNQHPFIFPTIKANIGQIQDAYVSIVVKALNEAVNGGR